MTREFQKSESVTRSRSRKAVQLSTKELESLRPLTGELVAHASPERLVWGYENPGKPKSRTKAIAIGAAVAGSVGGVTTLLLSASALMGLGAWAGVVGIALVIAVILGFVSTLMFDDVYGPPTLGVSTAVGSFVFAMIQLVRGGVPGEFLANKPIGFAWVAGILLVGGAAAAGGGIGGWVQTRLSARRWETEKADMYRLTNSMGLDYSALRRVQAQAEKLLEELGGNVAELRVSHENERRAFLGRLQALRGCALGAQEAYYAELDEEARGLYSRVSEHKGAISETLEDAEERVAQLHKLHATQLGQHGTLRALAAEAARTGETDALRARLQGMLEIPSAPKATATTDANELVTAAVEGWKAFLSQSPK